MKRKLTIIKVSVKDSNELVRIKNLLMNFYPKIPKYVILDNKRKLLSRISLVVDDINELRKYFNVTDKEWNIRKIGMESKGSEIVILIDSKKIDWIGLKNYVK
jgi:hypothetical protein